MSVITAERCSELPSVTADEVVAFVVRAAVWAPSVHNTQPWWFSGRGAEIILHADGQRQLTVADPAGREMMVSCGAALFTAKLALRSLGYIPETRVLPDAADPLVVARLRWRHRSPPTDYEERLYAAVPRRRTHRGGFGPLPLPPGLLPALRQDAIRDKAALRVGDGRREPGGGWRRRGDCRAGGAAGERLRARDFVLGAAPWQFAPRRRIAAVVPGTTAAHYSRLPEPGLRAWPRLGPA